jgi:chromosome segregation ATPase
MSKHGDPTVRQAMLALDWLDNNRERLRQTGQLRGEVYGPVAMHCSVADPACAAMLEKAIPMNKLMGFVAENDHDAMFLKNELRENRKIFVDIYTMKNIRINDPREYPDSLVAELGLKGYLCDQLDCPDIIRGLFYSFHNLQKVLWGRRADNLTSEHQTRLINQAGGFRLYLHDAGSSGGSSGGRQQRSNIVEYRGTVSRNAHMPPSTSSIGVTARGVLLSKGGDEDSAQRREELQRDLREAETKLRQAEKQMQEQQGKAREVAGKLHAKRGEMAELIRASKQPEQMRKDVLALQKKLSDLNQQLSVGADREKGAQVELYKNAIQSFLQAVSDTAAVAEKSNAHRVDREVAAALRDELLTALNDLSATLQDAKRGIKDLSKELAQAERERDDAARRQAEKETILEAQIASFGMSPEQFARDVYVAIEARCPETTVAELMVRIDQLNEDINKTADNPDLQRRYEDVTKEVTRLEQELQQASQEFENAQESMDKRAKKWEDMVGKITDKLNVKFETYMNDLQLGGKVKLKRVGNYNDYELQLMVRFRDNTDFSELDGNKHSGGERAVSTVMFLMALQDMTTSPFRVVDEINQGMDESIDRVVKSCCGDASKPQYFLVTPKLLQGLGAMRNDDVTILLVWNGPGAESKWEFTEILEDLSQGHVRRARPAASTAAPQRGMRVVKPEPGAAGSKRARQEVTEDEDEEGGASRGGKAGGQRGSTAKLVEVKKQKG